MSHSDGEEEQEEEQELLSPVQAGDEDESSSDEDEETSLARKFQDVLKILKEQPIMPYGDVEALINQTPWVAEKTAGDGDHNTLLHLLVEDARDKVRIPVHLKPSVGLKAIFVRCSRSMRHSSPFCS